MSDEYGTQLEYVSDTVQAMAQQRGAGRTVYAYHDRDKNAVILHFVVQWQR